MSIPLAILEAPRAAWHESAACRDSEPSLFFPVGTTGHALDQIAEAVAVCASCPVQEACLQYAFESNQESGVWGGYAEDDRRRLRKRWLAERRRGVSPQVPGAKPTLRSASAGSIST